MSSSQTILRWHPFYLTRPVLFTLAIVFYATVAAVEALSIMSNEKAGIGDWDSVLRYLAIYGPTGYLTILAAVWGRVEYQSKLFAPWIRLSKDFSAPRKNLLLDYVADFQILVVFKSLMNRDYVVSLATTVSLLIKTIVIISTSLTAISWITVTEKAHPVIAHDQLTELFDSLSSPLPYYVIKGLIDYDLPYPNGLSSRYAFQSVSLDNDLGLFPDTAELNVTVYAFETSFGCQTIDVSLVASKVEAMPPNPDEPKPLVLGTLEFNVVVPYCGEKRISRRSVWHCNQAEAEAARGTGRVGWCVYPLP